MKIFRNKNIWLIKRKRMETNHGSKRRNNGLWRNENHANAF